MMPDNVLSSEVVSARFYGARGLGVTKTIDYEDGGIDLNDSSQGLLYQRWRARLVKEDVLLSASNTSEFVLFSAPDLTEISITFDQNMRPALAYLQAGVAKLWWYDSFIAGMAITEIGSGIITPKVSMDDKRLIASESFQTNDVILAYVRDGNLYTRVQRDRFLIETLQAEDVKPLKKIGLNRQLRLQFMFEV